MKSSQSPWRPESANTSAGSSSSQQWAGFVILCKAEIKRLLTLAPATHRKINDQRREAEMSKRTGNPDIPVVHEKFISYL